MGLDSLPFGTICSRHCNTQPFREDTDMKRSIVLAVLMALSLGSAAFAETHAQAAAAQGRHDAQASHRSTYGAGCENCYRSSNSK